MKKTLSILLALVMLLAMAMPAMAEETNPGSITIKSVENVSVAGKTFNAYKILDLKMVGTEGYVYTVPAELVDFYTTEFGLDKTAGDFDYEVTQKITAMQNDSDALFAFAAKALAAAETANVSPATVTGAADAVTVKLENLPLGYYVIEDVGEATPISALMLDTTKPEVEITIKADKPAIEKKIDGDNDTDDTATGLVDYNNAAIGDKVPYVLTSAVPEMTGYTKYYYVVTDTMSAGLIFNNDVAVTLGDETLTKDEDYTVAFTNNEDGTTSIEIVFINFIQYKDNAKDAIKITYSATVDTDAVIGVVGNPNAVQLTYSNNPNIKDEGTPDNPNKPGENSPVGQTPIDETRTYVTDVKIIKVNAADERLEGAEFTLTGEKLNKVLVSKEAFVEDENGKYWKLTDGTYTTEDPATEDMDQSKYESTTTKYALKVVNEVVATSETVKATGMTNANGELTFTGLSAGEYTITEIAAPAGYNLLDAPINVTIVWTAPAGETTDCTWTYIWSDETTVGNTTTVLNETGTVLPETGGIGTTVFYVVGGLLLVVAFVVLVTRRRMNAEK